MCESVGWEEEGDEGQEIWKSVRNGPCFEEGIKVTVLTHELTQINDQKKYPGKKHITHVETFFTVFLRITLSLISLKIYTTALCFPSYRTFWG